MNGRIKVYCTICKQQYAVLKGTIDAEEYAGVCEGCRITTTEKDRTKDDNKKEGDE